MPEGVHTGPPAVETGDESAEPERRPAPGGWRRALTAFGLGAAAGALAALVLPREGARRRIGPGDRPAPFDPTD